MGARESGVLRPAVARNNAGRHGSNAMDLEQLTGWYFRLKHELATAYSAVPWNSGRVDRLTVR